MRTVRARVAHGIGERFLCHAEQAECHLRTKRLEVVSSVEDYGDVVMLLDIGAVPPQRRHQPRVLQHTGMQFV
jgi:hypothetical protein